MVNSAKLDIFGIVIVNYLPCTLSLDPFEPFSYGQTEGRQTVTFRLPLDTVAAVDSARRVSTVTFPLGRQYSTINQTKHRTFDGFHRPIRVFEFAGCE